MTDAQTPPAVVGRLDQPVRRRVVTNTMDCSECGWQGPSHEAEGGYCPMCGAEAADWAAVYNDDGTPRE